MLLELQHVSMSRPDRLKRRPIANTTPQSTPSFDPIYQKKKQDKELTGKKSQDLWRKREKVGKNLVAAEILVLVRNSQAHNSTV